MEHVTTNMMHIHLLAASCVRLGTCVLSCIVLRREVSQKSLFVRVHEETPDELRVPHHVEVLPAFPPCHLPTSFTDVQQDLARAALQTEARQQSEVLETSRSLHSPGSLSSSKRSAARND